MCLFRCLSFAYQWCSAPHSSPLCIHISHLYKFRALYNGDDTHAGHTPLLSTLLHSDMLRQCTPHECHSLQSTLQQSSRDPSSWDHSYKDPCQTGMYRAHYTDLDTGLWEARSLFHPSPGCRDIRHSHRLHDWSMLDLSNQLLHNFLLYSQQNRHSSLRCRNRDLHTKDQYTG